MRVQAQCFCIKVLPYSITPESHIVTLPVPERFTLETENEDFEDEEPREQQAAYKFLLKVLAEFLPRNLEREESMSLFGDNDGFFFSCSDADSDAHYHLIMKYAFF